MTVKPKAKSKAKLPKPKPPPATGQVLDLDTVGEWTDEHTKVIAQLIVDLEDSQTANEVKA